MVGVAGCENATKLLSFESMRVAYNEQRKLGFWTMPNWTPLSKFFVTKRSGSEIVFEKAVHDYRSLCVVSARVNCKRWKFR